MVLCDARLPALGITVAGVPAAYFLLGYGARSSGAARPTIRGARWSAPAATHG